jgi:outer membrane protein assembly factor BamB
MIIRLACLALLGLLMSGLDARASNWPRFRGPNGTGVSTDQGVPLSWKTPDEALWKVRIPGGGNASPVVWENRIFLQTAADDGNRRLLLCLDLETGKTLWQKSVDGNKARKHSKNTLASNTVATDGQRVYVPFWDGVNLSLSAYEFEGNVLWTRDLGEFKGNHGSGHSPVLYQDKVILANDQDGNSHVIALDTASGADVWKVARPPFRTCYSTPFLLEREGHATELIVASTAGISAYDPDTGHQNWNWDWSSVGKKLRTVGSPVFGDGLIYIGSGDGGGSRQAVAIKVDGTGDVTDSNLVWKVDRNFPYVPTMIARGKHLFYVNDRGVAACCIGKTGKSVWMKRLGGNVTASPVLIDGKVYAINEEGSVFVFNATEKFELLGESTVGEPVLASPAVASSRLLIRGKEHLFCFGKRELTKAAPPVSASSLSR